MAGDGCGPELARDEGLMVLICHLSAIRYIVQPELLHFYHEDPTLRCVFWCLLLKHLAIAESGTINCRMEECGVFLLDPKHGEVMKPPVVS